MKKWISLGMSLCVKAVALYNGSPSLPQIPEQNLFLAQDALLSLKLSMLQDFIWSRNLDGLSDPAFHAAFSGGVITIGWIDRVETYLLLGSESFSLSGDSCLLKAHGSFGGEIGARATVIFWGDTKLSMDAKYAYLWPHLDSGGQGWQREWQVGVALGQEFAWFTPYLGVKYARMLMKLSSLPSLGTLLINNTSPFGAFMGLSIAGRRGLFFDVEARFFDDNALALELGLRF